jgi:hypothetical protein
MKAFKVMTDAISDWVPGVFAYPVFCLFCIAYFFATTIAFLALPPNLFDKWRRS